MYRASLVMLGCVGCTAVEVAWVVLHAVASFVHSNSVSDMTMESCEPSSSPPSPPPVPLLVYGDDPYRRTLIFADLEFIYQRNGLSHEHSMVSPSTQCFILSKSQIRVRERCQRLRK